MAKKKRRNAVSKSANIQRGKPKRKVKTRKTSVAEESDPDPDKSGGDVTIQLPALKRRVRVITPTIYSFWNGLGVEERTRRALEVELDKRGICAPDVLREMWKRIKRYVLANDEVHKRCEDARNSVEVEFANRTAKEIISAIWQEMNLEIAMELNSDSDTGRQKPGPKSGNGMYNKLLESLFEENEGKDNPPKPREYASLYRERRKRMGEDDDCPSNAAIGQARRRFNEKRNQ